MAEAKAKGPSDERTTPCVECPLAGRGKEVERLLKLLGEMLAYTNEGTRPTPFKGEDILIDRCRPNNGEPATPPPTRDELAVVEDGLQRIAALIMAFAETPERDSLLSVWAACGRLLEKERSTPTTTEQEKVEYIAKGLIAGSIHLVASTMEPNLVSAELIDSVRRKLVARFVFETKFNGYYIKFINLLPI